MEVDYIQHCGSDLVVANAARVSFKKQKYILDERDEKLIKYLADHKHFSPFNHTFLTVKVKAPIFVARQLVKHEYMPWNEVSRRYVDEKPEFYWPDKWRERAPDKKQGSAQTSLLGWKHWWAQHRAEGAVNAAVWVYIWMLDNGVAPEQARIVLPQNMYTEWYWSGTIKAFAKMCQLRLKPDAQKETFFVADRIDTIAQEFFPHSWEALMSSEL